MPYVHHLADIRFTERKPKATNLILILLFVAETPTQIPALPEFFFHTSYNKIIDI